MIINLSYSSLHQETTVVKCKKIKWALNFQNLYYKLMTIPASSLLVVISLNFFSIKKV